MKKIYENVKASWNYWRWLLCGGDTEVKNDEKEKTLEEEHSKNKDWVQMDQEWSW